MPLRHYQPDPPRREAFAAFLDRIIGSESDRVDWFQYVVQHYFDEKIEAVRVDLVRLMLARDPGGHPLWQSSDFEQMKRWAACLREGNAA